MSTNLPGIATTTTAAEPRDVLLSPHATVIVPIIVDGTASTDGGHVQPSDLRPGWLMGRVTASGRWTPCKRTAVAAGATGTSTNVPVVNSFAFMVGDVITVGSTANLTISAVNHTTKTLTVSTGVALTAGNAVFAQDGSQTARGVLLDFIRLRTDSGLLPAHRSAGLLISGAVKTAMLLGDATACRADAAAKLVGLRFSDDHGQ